MKHPNQSERALLESGYFLDMMLECAASNAWPHIRTFAAGGATSTNEWLFRLDDEHVLYYLESTLHPLSYILVQGQDADGWLEHIKPAFPILSTEEVCRAWDLATTEKEREVVVYALALCSGHEPSLEVTRRVAAGLRDPSPAVRLSAVEAAYALAAADLDEYLHAMAKSDTDPVVRRAAGEALGRRASGS